MTHYITTQQLYLDVSKGGLGLPYISTRSLALQASKCARLLTPRDNCVRFLATRASFLARDDRFCPFEEAFETLSQSPEVSSKNLSNRTKDRVEDKKTTTTPSTSTGLI